jgi:hypothetical protein
VYPPGTHKPAWFTPDLWLNFDAYAYEERDARRSTTWMLLYNRQAGEGYFLVISTD